MKRKKSFHDFKNYIFHVLNPWLDCTSPSLASTTPQEEPLLLESHGEHGTALQGRQQLHKLRQR